MLILRVYQGSDGTYGRGKIRAAIAFDGIAVAKPSIERLRRDLGVRCVSPGRVLPDDRQLKTPARLFADLAIDALAMGLWLRRRAGQDVIGPIANNDPGVDNRAILYTQALAEAGAVASVRSRCASYDIVMAKALNSLSQFMS